MPSTSQRQKRAMQAAAHGQSTLGIPKKVGKEFVAADKAAPNRKLPQTAAKPSAAKPGR